jgi:hypothetical protein
VEERTENNRRTDVKNPVLNLRRAAANLTMGEGVFNETPPNPPAPNIDGNKDIAPASAPKQTYKEKINSPILATAQQQITKWFQKPSTLTNLGNSTIANTINNQTTSTTPTTATLNYNTTILKTNNVQSTDEDSTTNLKLRATANITSSSTTTTTTTNNQNTSTTTTKPNQIEPQDISMSSTENDITSINNNNDEEAHIINKYADELDNISNEFIEKLPPNDKAALTRLLEQQQQIIPLEQPFILVQPKTKSKSTNTNNLTKKPNTSNNKDMITPPVSPKIDRKLSQNEPFSFGNNIQETSAIAFHQEEDKCNTLQEIKEEEEE